MLEKLDSAFSDQTINDLKEELKSGLVKPADRFIKYPHLQAYVVIEQANRIFGFDGWSLETVKKDYLGAEEVAKKDGGTQWEAHYETTSRVTLESGVIREGSAGGSAYGKTALLARDNALKTAESTSMKRAFRTFGAQFGNHLYGSDNWREVLTALENTDSQGYKDLLDIAKRITKEVKDRFDFDAPKQFLGISYNQMMSVPKVKDAEALSNYIDKVDAYIIDNSDNHGI